MIMSNDNYTLTNVIQSNGNCSVTLKLPIFIIEQ